MTDNNDNDKQSQDKQLNIEQQRKAIEWLKTKTISKGCEVCGKSDWIVPEHIVTPMVMKGNNINLGGSSYP